MDGLTRAFWSFVYGNRKKGWEVFLAWARLPEEVVFPYDRGALSPHVLNPRPGTKTKAASRSNCTRHKPFHRGRRAARPSPSLSSTLPRGMSSSRVRATRAWPRPSMRNSGVGPRARRHLHACPRVGRSRPAATHARTWTATGTRNPRRWVVPRRYGRRAAPPAVTVIADACVRVPAFLFDP